MTHMWGDSEASKTSSPTHLPNSHDVQTSVLAQQENSLPLPYPAVKGQLPSVPPGHLLGAFIPGWSCSFVNPRCPNWPAPYILPLEARFHRVLAVLLTRKG